MRHVVGFEDQSMERGTLGGEFVAHYCNQWDILSQRRGSVPKLLWADLFCYCVCCYISEEVEENLLNT